MKKLARFDQVVNAVIMLPVKQQKIIAGLIHNWHIENRRNEIANDAHKTLAYLRSGKLKPQSAEDVIRELRHSLED